MANSNDYGILGLADLGAQRVSEAGVSRVFGAVAEATAEYNRVINSLMGNWATRTTTAQEQFELAGSGTLQPIDADGNPLPVLPSGSYQVAFPIQGGGHAWGTNRITRALMTVEEAERFTQDAMRRDADWLTRHMLSALLDSSSWTFNDIYPSAAQSSGLGNVTVQPLANSDSVTYNRKGNNAAATDTHYLAQAADISDAANPFTTIRSELLEHPSNMNGAITAYVATDLTDDIEGLAGFTEVSDPDVIYGDNTDRVAYREFADAGPGDAVLGRVSRIKIVEWGALPSGYMIAKMDDKAPLRMRELPSPELQGLFAETNDVDGNHWIQRMIRFAGFGVADRVAAVVYQIGNGTYTVPSGYDAPLAV